MYTKGLSIHQVNWTKIPWSNEDKNLGIVIEKNLTYSNKITRPR